MRKCHLGTCPVGIATQDPELRKRFAGKAGVPGALPDLRGRGSPADHGPAGLPQVRRDDRPRRAAAAAARRSTTGRPRGWTSRPSSRRPTSPTAARCGASARRATRTRTTSTGRSCEQVEHGHRDRRAGAAGDADPQRPPHGGRDPQQPHRQAARRARACPTARSTSPSAARPGRASGRSWPRA